MSKMKDLVLDDYVEDNYDFEIDYDYGRDTSDFIEDYDVEKYANYESKKENSDKDKKNSKDVYLGKNASFAVNIMSLFSNWFSILGLGIAVVLILFFLFTLQFDALALY